MAASNVALLEELSDDIDMSVGLYECHNLQLYTISPFQFKNSSRTTNHCHVTWSSLLGFKNRSMKVGPVLPPKVVQ